MADPDGGHFQLAARYDRAAARWSGSIARLGYPEAYRMLAARGLAAEPQENGGCQLRVLDAGCGAGDLALAFAQMAERPVSVDLVDLSPAMLARAETALRGIAVEARTICAPVEDAMIDPAGYDFVLCAHLLEHVPRGDATLTRLRTTLRVGGTLLLIANQPHWCTRLIQLRWHTRAFLPAQIEQWLEAAGFSRVERVPFSCGPPSRTSMGYLARP